MALPKQIPQIEHAQQRAAAKRTIITDAMKQSLANTGSGSPDLLAENSVAGTSLFKPYAPRVTREAPLPVRAFPEDD
jgi:hypothetical protein